MPKKTEPPPDTPTLVRVPKDQAAEKLSARIAAGDDLLNRPVTNLTDAQTLQTDYWTWSEYNEELLLHLFTGDKLRDEYRGFTFGAPSDPRELRRYVHERIKSESRTLLSIRNRLEVISEAPNVAPVVHKVSGTGSTSRKVFVVHGHDDAARESVARFLSKLDLEPIILHEQPNAGQTIVEKLEKNGDVAFAVVLLTPDDVGGKVGGEQAPRARQNVVLELGYFVGRLGRNKVCALHKGPIELPSDYMGVIYVPLDPANGWRLLLAKELKEAGFHIDLNKAL